MAPTVTKLTHADIVAEGNRVVERIRQFQQLSRFAVELIALVVLVSVLGNIAADAITRVNLPVLVVAASLLVLISVVTFAYSRRYLRPQSPEGRIVFEYRIAPISNPGSRAHKVLEDLSDAVRAWVAELNSFQTLQLSPLPVQTSIVAETKHPVAIAALRATEFEVEWRYRGKRIRWLRGGTEDGTVAKLLVWLGVQEAPVSLLAKVSMSFGVRNPSDPMSDDLIEHLSGSLTRLVTGLESQLGKVDYTA